MSDIYFREILGVGAEATRAQIRQAYRKLVMENHPDRFPAEKKALQELATITLTEAYSALMGISADAPELRREKPAAERARPAQGNGPSAGQAGEAHNGSGEQPAANQLAPASLRDPAYAYYKQGFINFSLAIHGIAETNRKLAAGRVPRFTRRYTGAEDIASSLGLLRAAHGYFSRVVEDHPRSVWSADSRTKLWRIEHFTIIYRRILQNLKSR
jgi:curved DNA-binding protein CbpA